MALIIHLVVLLTRSKFPVHFLLNLSFYSKFLQAKKVEKLAKPRVKMAKQKSHIETLLSFQHESGSWYQVIERTDTYLELTATCILGYVISRGLNNGWLSGDYGSALSRAWDSISQCVDEDGNVSNACAGTGPLATLEEYLLRPTADGYDDRSGGMALWFAIEYQKFLDTSV